MSVVTALRDPPRVPDLERRIAFLTDPASYPEGVRSVRAIETHRSWVFLTERNAYKLKKPEALDVDLRAVEAREAHCRAEVRLNRRLADDVYLGVVALRTRPSGALALGGEGEAVDWLVWMRRLPGDRMLDAMIRMGTVLPKDVRAFVEPLTRFYKASVPAATNGPERRAHLAARIAQIVQELTAHPRHLPRLRVEDIAEAQLAFLERHDEMLDRRVAEGHCLEGHGDLRPEHICLESAPRIIDCLDFSQELRIVDPAEELGFLSLECERLYAPWVKEAVFDVYTDMTGDRPDAGLVHFYQSCHACVRANLALRHLLDPHPREPQRWPTLARVYLRLATAHLEAAGCDLPSRH